MEMYFKYLYIFKLMRKRRTFSKIREINHIKKLDIIRNTMCVYIYIFLSYYYL